MTKKRTNNESNLEIRCRALLNKDCAPSVQDLRDFVHSEIGRKADPRLDNTLALIIYFQDEVSRDDMIAAIRHEKPGMRARKIP